MRRTFLIGGVIAALAVPAVVLAELPTAEQNCINTMNKDGVKVQAAQIGVNNKCSKDAVKQNLSPAPVALACINADPKGKVSKRKSKTIGDASKKCSVPPGIFYAGPAATNVASEESAKTLWHDMFGPALGALQSCDTNPNECKCQVKVSSRVGKLERAMASAWLRCKKAAMKGSKEPFVPGGALTNAELEQCIDNPSLAGGHSVAADTKGAIAKGAALTKKSAEQFCAKGIADEFATGGCAGFSTPPALDGNGLTDCFVAHARCRLCEMVNASDGLSVDCDAFAGIACSP